MVKRPHNTFQAPACHKGMASSPEFSPATFSPENPSCHRECSGPGLRARGSGAGEAPAHYPRHVYLPVSPAPSLQPGPVHCCPGHPAQSAPPTPTLIHQCVPGRCLLALGLSFLNCASHCYALLFSLVQSSRNSPQGKLGAMCYSILRVSTELTTLPPAPPSVLGSQHPGL